jgi:hypothetical protein
MEFRLTITTDNAAFEHDPSREVSRILADVAKKIDARWFQDPDSGALRDVNGNKVGEWEVL